MKTRQPIFLGDVLDTILNKDKIGDILEDKAERTMIVLEIQMTLITDISSGPGEICSQPIYAYI